MTIAEVAKLTGKSEQSIRRAIKAGKLKATLIDGHYEINENDLSDYQGVSQSDSQTIDTDSQAIVREKDVLIELLKQQLTEKDQQISQQQAIIMQLSRNQQLMIESSEQKEKRL
jgi:excisionase family DNA binding protein